MIWTRRRSTREPDSRTISAGGSAWRGLGACVQGARHVKTGEPCQDALGWSLDTRLGPTLVMAVADGHGNKRHFRSADGARLAVEVGTRLLDDFLRAHAAERNPERLAFAGRALPAALETAWKAAVEHHMAGCGSDEQGDHWFEDVPDPQLADPDRYIPYGTTLLLAGATPWCQLVLQIGDGDVVVLDAEGAVTRPLPPDPLLAGNETTSLCQPNATSSIRVACLAGTPALVMAATDGYANSFQADADFLQVAFDYRSMIVANGTVWVADHLEAWLRETSTHGSGDDITVGLLMPEGQPG
jgi:hypothetical protein